MLTVGISLLSYFNVHLHGFLPRGLTLGEAWHLNPRQIREGSLLLVINGSTDWVFHGWAKHIPIKESSMIDQAKETTTTELVDSSSKGTETEKPTVSMTDHAKETTTAELVDSRAR